MKLAMDKSHILLVIQYEYLYGRHYFYFLLRSLLGDDMYLKK